jgi:hypothetical protein
MRAKGREIGGETHHRGQDPGIRRLGSEEEGGGTAGVRSVGGGGERRFR